METDDVIGGDPSTVTHRTPADHDERSPDITTVRTSPGRILFSETDNPDGWIATDLCIEVEQ
ncbi:MAG: hypothetical protein V5A46_07305 [Haloferacaceae archaeon]